MKLYNFMLPEYKNQIIEVPKTKEHRLGIIPSNNASKELIQSIFRFEITDKDVDCYDPKALSDCMINKFKVSECYKAKTEAERLEIIRYLKDNPEPEEEGIDY